jgi:hypothetical protein
LAYSQSNSEKEAKQQKEIIAKFNETQFEQRPMAVENVMGIRGKARVEGDLKYVTHITNLEFLIRIN